MKGKKLMVILLHIITISVKHMKLFWGEGGKGEGRKTGGTEVLKNKVR